MPEHRQSWITSDRSFREYRQSRITGDRSFREHRKSWITSDRSFRESRQSRITSERSFRESRQSRITSDRSFRESRQSRITGDRLFRESWQSGITRVALRWNVPRCKLPGTGLLPAAQSVLLPVYGIFRQHRKGQGEDRFASTIHPPARCARCPPSKGDSTSSHVSRTQRISHVITNNDSAETPPTTRGTLLPCNTLDLPSTFPL